MRVAVLRPQVPFVRGGAEIFTDRLVAELHARGHETDLVSVPFKWYPGARVLTQAFLWRLLDLEEADGQRIDVVVATKFPSYLVRHHDKRVWLVHQFRQAYELDRTELGQFGESPDDRALRRKVQALDRVALGEATRLFATSRNVAGRLERSTGLEAEVLSHPPQDLAYRCDGYGDFVLSVNRLDRAKRIDAREVEVHRDGAAILARVKDYKVEFDPVARTISHDCEDWASVGPRKDFCKHLGKFFLSLPREDAIRHLESIRGNREGWTFETRS